MHMFLDNMILLEVIMKEIKLLDTTLRDGMNVTDFFTEDRIKRKIVVGLESTGVDIIECGFLVIGDQKENCAKYTAVENISPFIQPKRPDVQYAAIIQLFDGAAPHISPRDNTTVDIIRIAAMKRGMPDALRLVDDIRSKGYDVMLQPSRTSDYSEKELRELIRMANNMDLYGFAIVDTFGNMLPRDVLTMVALYEEHLDKSIKIGFHFHNNMQLAFANAISLLESMKSEHSIIIDGSIFGMGSGAGNLPIELMMQYLNTNYDKEYDIELIFELYETYLQDIFKVTHWGYQPRNFITAVCNAQPYYGVYLETKYGFNSKHLNAALLGMTEEERARFSMAQADEMGKSRIHAKG